MIALSSLAGAMTNLVSRNADDRVQIVLPPGFNTLIVLFPVRSRHMVSVEHGLTMFPFRSAGNNNRETIIPSILSK